MNQQTFREGIVSVSITHVLVFIFGFIMSILNARLLGPEGLGMLALLRSLQLFSVRITDFGFGRALRYYSANGEISYSYLKKNVLQLGFLIGIIVLLISMLLKYIPINIWNDIELTIYLLFLPTIFFMVLTMYLRHLLHGQLLINYVNISTILERVSYILLFLLFVWYLDLGMKGVAIALSISSFILFLQLVLRAKKHEKSTSENRGTHNSYKMIKKLWSYGQWSYYSSIMDYLINNFPILYLKSSIGAFSEIGFFSKARGLAEYPRTTAVPVSGLLFSFNASSLKGIANNRTDTICRISFVIVTVFYIILSIFIKPIISFFYGDDFLPAAEIFYYLYPSVVFYMQSLFLSSAIAAKGFNKETFTIRLKSLPLIVIVGYFLITYQGTLGAAITVSFSATLLWFQYARKYFNLLDSNFNRILLLRKQDIHLLKNVFFKVLRKK